MPLILIPLAEDNN